MELTQIRKTHKWGALAGLTFACLGQGGQASAAGFALRNQSASALGTGLAADGVNSYDASGIFANPAVMTEFKGQNFSVGVDYIQANIKAKDAALTNTLGALGPVPNNNQGESKIDTVSDPVAVPSIYGVHQVNDQVHVGWGVTVPFATNTKYNETWAGRYYATKTRLQVTEFALAGSYKLNEMVGLAAALNYQTAIGELNSAVDLGLGSFKANPSATTQAAIGRVDALSKYEADSTGLGFQVGVLAKPIPELKVGLSYRSSIEHKAKGDMKFTGTTPTANAALAATTNPLLQNSSDAKLDFKLPSIIALGAAYSLDAFTYYANITHTAWKSFDKFEVKYNGVSSTTKLDWKDSLYLALGADYRLNPEVTLRAGISSDKGVTDDTSRTPRTPDNNRTGVSIGVGYLASEKVKLNAAYQKLFLPTTKVKLSDQAYPDAAGRGNLTTEYDINPNIFMASVDVAL